MKKTGKRFIVALAATVILLFCVPFFTGCMDPGYTILLFSMCGRPDPPAPEITSAEFPFRIVYTVDGEETVYEDVITCEYTGINNDASRSEKYRTWSKEYGKNSDIILRELGNDQGIVFWINYSAAYLMGDTENHRYYDDPPEIALATEFLLDTGVPAYFSDKKLEAQELKEVYGIEIISFEMSPPVVNSFSSEGAVSDSE